MSRLYGVIQRRPQLCLYVLSDIEVKYEMKAKSERSRRQVMASLVYAPLEASLQALLCQPRTSLDVKARHSLHFCISLDKQLASNTRKRYVFNADLSHT